MKRPIATPETVSRETLLGLELRHAVITGRGASLIPAPAPAIALNATFHVKRPARLGLRHAVDGSADAAHP